MRTEEGSEVNKSSSTPFNSHPRTKVQTLGANVVPLAI